MKLPLGLAVTHNEPLYRWTPASTAFYSACVLGTQLLSPPVSVSGGVDGDSGPHFGCSCIFTPFHRLKGYGSLKTGQRKFPYYFSRDRGSEGIFMQPCFTSTFQGRTQQFLILVFDTPNKHSHRRLLQSVVFNGIRSIIHIYSMTIYFSMSIFFR